MASMNRATLIGNLGEDPKKEYLKDGSFVVRFSLATSESWKDKQTGERKERTEWHRIVIWNEKLCDFAEKHLRKGSQICLEGSIQTRKWTTQDGQERYTTEIVLPRFGGSILTLSHKKEISSTATEPEPSKKSYEYFEDEIPY